MFGINIFNSYYVFMLYDLSRLYSNFYMMYFLNEYIAIKLVKCIPLIMVDRTLAVVDKTLVSL